MMQSLLAELVESLLMAAGHAVLKFSAANRLPNWSELLSGWPVS
jgi:hypothetical protein